MGCAALSCAYRPTSAEVAAARPSVCWRAGRPGAVHDPQPLVSFASPTTAVQRERRERPFDLGRPGHAVGQSSRRRWQRPTNDPRGLLSSPAPPGHERWLPPRTFQRHASPRWHLFRCSRWQSQIFHRRPFRMIVFLDFDGVLHPDRSNMAPKFCRMPLLEAWLRERPVVEVVISSSWREVHPFEELVSFFSEDLQTRVVGCTPRLQRSSDGGRFVGWAQTSEPFGLPVFARELECRRWMHSSWEPCRNWAALDDMPELFEPTCAELVVCDPALGLTQAQLVEVDRRLRTGL